MTARQELEELGFEILSASNNTICLSKGVFYVEIERTMCDGAIVNVKNLLEPRFHYGFDIQTMNLFYKLAIETWYDVSRETFWKPDKKFVKKAYLVTTNRGCGKAEWAKRQLEINKAIKEIKEDPYFTFSAINEWWNKLDEQSRERITRNYTDTDNIKEETNMKTARELFEELGYHDIILQGKGVYRVIDRRYVKEIHIIIKEEGNSKLFKFTENKPAYINEKEIEAFHIFIEEKRRESMLLGNVAERLEKEGKKPKIRFNVPSPFGRLYVTIPYEELTTATIEATKNMEVNHVSNDNVMGICKEESEEFPDLESDYHCVEF